MVAQHTQQYPDGGPEADMAWEEKYEQWVEAGMAPWVAREDDAFRVRYVTEFMRLNATMFGEQGAYELGLERAEEALAELKAAVAAEKAQERAEKRLAAQQQRLAEEAS
jgi:hypothetical protein